jgi:serine protease AprX
LNTTAIADRTFTARARLDRTIAIFLAVLTVIAGGLAAGRLPAFPPLAAAKTDPSLVSAAAAQPDRTLQVIVRETNPSSGAAEQLVRSDGGQVTRQLPIVGGFAAVVPASSLASLADSGSVTRLWADGRVRMSDVNYAKFDALAPNTLWRSYIKLPSVAYDGTGATVALLDTGITPSPDLAGRIIDSVDFTAENDNLDHFGHGTHMAGIIAGDGTMSNGKWAGVAPGADLVSVKVAPSDGSTDVSVVIAALQWIIANQQQDNIRVLNLSFGTDSSQPYSVDPLDYAVEQVWNAGIVVVAAAGNRGPGPGTVNKPGDDPFIITVGAMNGNSTLDKSDDVIPGFSSRGPTQDGFQKPDLVAPGVTIVSLRDPGSAIDQQHPDAVVGNYYFKGTGTSQASAVVSGVAALMVDARPSITPNQVKAILLGTAMPYLAGPASGAGLVNAYAATVAAAFTPNKYGRANQGLTPSTGLGSLEASRGSFHVYADPDGDGVPQLIQGEVDVRGIPWVANSWSANNWDANNWNANSWSSVEWAANAWDANNWDANQWDSNSWDSNAWDANTWS